MAGLSLAFTSCVDMDMVPKSQGNSESWYTTETELKMAVNEFYILGYWKMDSPESMEQYSDNFTYRNTNRKTLLDGTLNGQTYEVYHLWQQSYKLIARANSLLEGVERARNAGLSEEVINQYEGEAYFARACKYADLIFYWGDVPYLDKYMTITEAERMGRKPKAELIPLVYEDFDKAIEDTLIALNTGVLRTRDGSILKQADGKSSIQNSLWREKLYTIADMLTAIRRRLKIAKKEKAYSTYGTGEDVAYCFYDRELAEWFNSTREEILKILSSICKEAGLRELHFQRRRYRW